MDDADRADKVIEEERLAGMLQARLAPALRAKQRCHFCNESIADRLLFCDPDCAQDFENEEEQLKRMGRDG